MKREYIPEPRRDQQEPRWWQTMNTGAFMLKLRTMTREEVENLSAEIRGAIAVIQSQLESRGRSNLLWWKSARSALGFMHEKQGLVRSELTRLNKVSRESRVAGQDHDGQLRRRISKIREQRLLEIRDMVASDPTAALTALLDWLLDRKMSDDHAASQTTNS